jgi:molybdenum cofactor cytidylyltransferase
MAISGDVGARHVIASYGEAVVEVPVQEEGAFLDVDTPEALVAAKAGLQER